jgi:hypothetical protein
LHPPVHSLLELALARPELGLSPGAWRALSEAREAELCAALDLLAPHKLTSLLAHQAKLLGLLEQLPPVTRERLVTGQRETRATNALLFVTAASVLRALAARAELPLLLKGLLFADSYYPDPATRPMSDIDLVCAPGQQAALFEALEGLGFHPSDEHRPSPDGVTYMDRRGLVCDAHTRLRMFDGMPWEQLTVRRELSKLRGLPVRSLEPNAMLAHLAVHMHGHLRELGLVLLWLLDMAFVLRRHAAELDPERVRALCRDDAAFVLLLRALQLLSRHGEQLPAAWARRAGGLLPLSLGSVLRQRRITPWGLPGPKGFLRVLAHRVALRRYDRFPQPRATDLLLWPLDELSLRAAPRQFARARGRALRLARRR